METQEKPLEDKGMEVIEGIEPETLANVKSAMEKVKAITRDFAEIQAETEEDPDEQPEIPLEEQIVRKLNRYTDLNGEIYAISVNRDEAALALISKEIKEQTQAIAALAAARILPLDEEMSKLAVEIRQLTVENESTVKANKAMAVFSMRGKWNTAGLKGYAVSDKKVLKFYSEKPSVSIRMIK